MNTSVFDCEHEWQDEVITSRVSTSDGKAGQDTSCMEVCKKCGAVKDGWVSIKLEPVPRQ